MMIRWHQQLGGHELEALGGSGGQGSLRAAAHRLARSPTSA